MLQTNLPLFFLLTFHKEPKTDGRERLSEGADPAGGAVPAASI